ncbi:Accessory secretory protein Asp2 [Streptococcus mitis]|uniref:Accessory secretory protein Asp2 n=1 Tax=Streptococcus mitis TaxID=28037 RepID=A0A150NX70_STRMT|nr:Accessory secretory protein Asp2 [Streptococcus mitis]
MQDLSTSLLVGDMGINYFRQIFKFILLLKALYLIKDWSM